MSLRYSTIENRKRDRLNRDAAERTTRTNAFIAHYFSWSKYYTGGFIYPHELSLHSLFRPWGAMFYIIL